MFIVFRVLSNAREYNSFIYDPFSIEYGLGYVKKELITLTVQNYHTVSNTRPRGYNTFFKLYLAEHEISTALRS